jgi:hypothetical protein
MGIVSHVLVATLALGAADSLYSPAMAQAPFASKAEAEAYLAHAIPAVTAANPKYRTPGNDLESRWLANTINFKTNDKGGVALSMDESIEDYRGGALVGTRTHTAALALDEVAISENTADDLAENGDKARGVMFRCTGAPCIDADWSGAKSMSAWTDIYLQDDAERGKILNALKVLQGASASP